MTRTYAPNDRQGLHTDKGNLVRKAVTEDLPGIVTIHEKAFSHFFLTQLGEEFLRRYYGLVLSYRAGIVLVSEERGWIDGFACGFVNPPEFYRLMWSRKAMFVLPAMSALIRHPSLAAQVLDGMRRIQTSASQGHAQLCELASIAVAPEVSGSGTGKALVESFLQAAWSMEAHSVYLTTDTHGNEPTNAFYRKAGFQRARQFLQRRGRWMNEYVMHRRQSSEQYEIRP
jgi:ribosomal protein S18 acetylase RimI-like enzyme